MDNPNDMNYNKKVGERLKKARESAGLSLKAASEALDGALIASRIGNYEQGTRKISHHALFLLADLYRESPAYLYYIDKGDSMRIEEERLLNDWRALPENERRRFARNVAAAAIVHKDAVEDERAHPSVPKSKTRQRRQQAVKKHT
jgi:transcriptional regulator with XRE-family HTH domain